MKLSLLRLWCAAGLFLLAVTVLAQGPNKSGKYYKPADGLTGEELKTALFNIIRDPNIVDYAGLKQAYIITDTRPDGYLRDFYSDITQYVPGSNMTNNTAEGATYNREHTVCQSWFGSVDPMYSDIIQVIPTDGYINSRHNDNPYGEVTDNEANYNQSQTGYSKWGAPREGLGQPEEVTTVFEPNDEVKGDIARIYFYMATCYQDRATTFTEGKGQYVFNEEGTAYQPLQQWVFDMMMEWSKLDPVDEIETLRNDSVYKVQRNRNPFVDYPGLEDYIWGEKMETPFSYDYYEGVEQGEDMGEPDPDFSPLEDGTTISFNSNFFNVTWTGVRPANNRIILTGQQGNVKVLYYAGRSSSSSVGNMYCNDKQIRLYKKNTLTMRITDGLFSKLVFDVAGVSQDQQLNTDEGPLEELTWTGNADEVVFYVNDANGNVQLRGVSVYSVATGIWALPEPTYSNEVEAIYNLQGMRFDSMQPGINIVRMKDGRVIKIVVR